MMTLKYFLAFFFAVMPFSFFAQKSVQLKVMTYNLRFGELASIKEIADFMAQLHKSVAI